VNYLLDTNAVIALPKNQLPIVRDRLRRAAARSAPIGPYDLLIAAQALRSGATLITANVSEFARVRGLSWREWTAKA